MPAVHEKSARPSNVSHHVNQVGFMNDNRVARQDGNVALRVIGYIARQWNSNRFVRLIAMCNRDASARLFRESSSDRNEIEQALLSRHRIHTRPCYLTQYAGALRSILVHKQCNVGAFHKAAV